MWEKNTYQRVDTYSVNGGLECISRARPKSAIFTRSLVTSKFSKKGIIQLIRKVHQNIMYKCLHKQKADCRKEAINGITSSDKCD